MTRLSRLKNEGIDVKQSYFKKGDQDMSPNFSPL